MAIAAGVLLSALAAASASASAATGPITWGAPAAVDTQQPWGQHGDLKGISCLSTPLCVAVGASGHVVSSTDPGGGASAWRITSLPGVDFATQVSCANGPFCVVIGSNFNANWFIATSSDPTGGSSAWSVEPFSVSGVTGVSCASSSFCALVDGAGNVWSSSTPTNAASWSRNDIDGIEPLTGISCPSTSLCVATDAHGFAAYSTDPTDPSPAWTLTNVAGSNHLDAVSCITSGECWIADGQGNVWHSNGSAYSGAWTSVAVGVVATNGAWTDISCSNTACAAVTSAGYFAGSKNPTSTQSSDWTVQSVDSSHSSPSVACPSTACVAVDTTGNALTTSDPTGSWTTTWVDGKSEMVAVSCPSVSLCVGGDDAGAVLSSADPAGGAGSWQRALVDSTPIDSVSCPSGSLCVAGDSQGRILTSSAPAGGASAWSAPVSLASHPLSSISCPTVSFCVAVDEIGGNVWTSTNPTGGAGTWSSASIDPGQDLVYVSCPTASLCVAADGNGNVLTSTDPAGGASAWSAPVPIDPGQTIDGVSCASTTLCAAVDANGTAFVSSPPTTGNWQAETVDASGGGFAGVACRPASTCTAVDFDGNALGSAGPAGGTGTWSAPRNIDNGNISGFNGVTCSPGLLCVAFDNLGDVVVGKPPAPSASGTPTITGTAAIGQQLTESHAAWTGDPVSFTYQWEDCDAGGGACTAIAGATAQTYIVRASDAGHILRVQETAVNAGGSGAPAMSAATSVVPAVSTPTSPSGPSVSVAPKVSGAPIVGRRLHASPGTWSGTGPLAYAYQWQACRRSCTNLAGATGSSYLVRQRDSGARIRVEIIATNAVGSASAVSGGVGPVLTVKQIRRVVLQASVPHGRAARYAAILAAHGFTTVFRGLLPGKLRIVWKSHGIVVAAGTLHIVSSAGRHRLVLRLTAAGRRLLSAHFGALYATTTFTPAGAKALSFSERFGLGS